MSKAKLDCPLIVLGFYGMIASTRPEDYSLFKVLKMSAKIRDFGIKNNNPFRRIDPLKIKEHVIEYDEELILR